MELHQRPSPQEWPHQVGLTDVKIDPAEVLPRRVQNLLGPRSSAASMPAEGGASLDSSLMMFMMTLLLALHCVPTKVPTRAKTTSCRFYSCSFGLRPPVACQGDSEPSLGRVHWWTNRADNARATGSSLVATKKKKQD